MDQVSHTLQYLVHMTLHHFTIMLLLIVAWCQRRLHQAWVCVPLNQSQRGNQKLTSSQVMPEHLEERE
jgi:hypothetical protein